MDKKSKIALYLIVFVILMMMVSEVTKPKSISWRDSYSAADKIPLGCYVVYNELKNENGKRLKISSESIFEYLKKNDSLKEASLIFINNSINLGKQESQALLRFVEKGNAVFFSSLYMSALVADTLNVEFSRDYDNFFKVPSQHTFSSPGLRKNQKLYEDVIENGYISSFDTINGTILGTLKNEDSSVTHTNFVKVKFGEEDGAFYFHTNPFAFANYHMLDAKEDYAASVLSFLPNDLIIWDNYYKSGRKVIKSPLRFVLTNPGLRWAFYLIMFTMAIFVLFKGKRTQRIIPVVEPLKNSTVDFTKTIGNLYLQNGDYSNIVHKKIKFFLESVRSKYYLNTQELNETFISKLALKSNNTIEDTKKLIDLFVYLKSKKAHSEQDLKSLNKIIESFTNKDIYGRNTQRRH